MRISCRVERHSDDRAKLAPFRLLALGDPQLEGDTSIITNYLGTFPHLKQIYKHVTFQTKHWCFRERVRKTLHDTVDFYMEDIPYFLESMRKRFDLWGNDFYLAHIYRQVNWWSNPTHVSVLGDLVGSQWIDDVEFEKRGRRFWNRTFRGTERVPDEIARYPSTDYTLSGILDGNHDIGYAGDLTEERLERFERVFGKANYELRFELPILDPEKRASMYHGTDNPNSDRITPELRIIVVNDMNLDTPAKSAPLQDATYAFINDVIGTSNSVNYKGHFTLILTHIPLYKPAGICVDSPFFSFHTAADGGGLKEQNQLSADASKGFLEGMWGMSGKENAAAGGYGRAGLMLNGHDHAGCDTYHFINQTNGTDASERQWQTVRWEEAQEQKDPRHLGDPWTTRDNGEEHDGRLWRQCRPPEPLVRPGNLGVEVRMNRSDGNSYFERSSGKDDLYFSLQQTSTTMYCFHHLATLFLFTTLSQAAPQNDDRNLQQREPRDVPKIPRDFGEDVLTHPAVVVVTTTNYETMPVGTYTETISEGAIRVIVVVDATATSKSRRTTKHDVIKGIKIERLLV
ncbi:hypothetical protein CEP52_009129 [Fusarium oligoseptatum]|uniref:Uncharacterized protein n=1 Tax=Fusarium oligoseptatum TaxID=2604345 RepID=A0A428TED5_9HYPO|nr:hypothetical protein CEP52_009129 [Fusarium oligoseptatum]